MPLSGDFWKHTVTQNSRPAIRPADTRVKPSLARSTVGLMSQFMSHSRRPWRPQPTHRHKAARAEGPAAHSLNAPSGRRIAQGGYTRLPSIPRDSPCAWRAPSKPDASPPPSRPAAGFFFWHSRRPTRRRARGRRALVTGPDRRARRYTLPSDVSPRPVGGRYCRGSGCPRHRPASARRPASMVMTGSHSRVLSNRPGNFPPPLIFFQDVSVPAKHFSL